MIIAADKREAKERAQEFLQKWSSGLTTSSFFPGASYSLGAIDLTLVTKIGEIYGVSLDKTAAAEIFTSVAYPLIYSRSLTGFLDFIPFIGWAAKSAIYYAVTKKVGQALIDYFETKSNLPK